MFFSLVLILCPSTLDGFVAHKKYRTCTKLITWINSAKYITWINSAKYVYLFKQTCSENVIKYSRIGPAKFSYTVMNLRYLLNSIYVIGTLCTLLVHIIFGSCDTDTIPLGSVIT